MQVEYLQSPWGDEVTQYSSLFITELPGGIKTESIDISPITEWAKENLSAAYLPTPFLSLANAIKPWRHYPSERWIACLDSIKDFKYRNFVDMGGNTGYYCFLAKAFGARYSLLVDHDPILTAFASMLDSHFKVGIDVLLEDMSIWRPGHFDFAFCFSAIGYLGYESAKRTLSHWKDKIDVLFIEMGDGGSLLEGVESPDEHLHFFDSCGWRPSLISNVYASHTNTVRPLYRLDSTRVLNMLDPFFHIGDSVQSHCYRDGRGLVLKDMTGGFSIAFDKEVAFQTKFNQAYPQFSAKIEKIGDRFLLMEDLGDSEPISDWNIFLRSVSRLLDALASLNICHGDLTLPNLIVKDNQMKILDFGNASYGGNRSDIETLWDTVKEMRSVPTAVR